MDATQTTQHTQSVDEPMSVELLRELIYDRQALTLDELGLLLGGLSRSGTHRYLESTELRFGQLLCLYRQARSDAVREAINRLLNSGTGYATLKLPGASDLDGDGDIDTDDALRSAAGVIRKASNALDLVLNVGDAHEYTDARRALKDAAERALAAVAIIDFIEAHAPKRRKAKPLNGFAGKGVAR